MRGCTLFAGYDSDEKATREAVTPSGWFRTGDLCSVDAHGYLTVTDRAKDMVLARRV